NLCLRRRLSGYASRQLVINRVRKTHRNIYYLTLSLGTITYALQDQLALRACAEASDHVVDQGTESTGKRIGLTGFVHGRYLQYAGINRHLHILVNVGLQRTLAAFDSDFAVSDNRLNTLWQGNRV